MVSLDHPLAQDALLARTKAVPPGAEVGTPTPTRIYPTARTRDKHTYLYVAVSGAYTKIGFAANLRIRLSNMRVDNPHGVEIARYWEMDRAEARFLENICHQDWIERWVVGEWHRGTATEAVELVECHKTIRAEMAELRAARESHVDPLPPLPTPP